MNQHDCLTGRLHGLRLREALGASLSAAALGICSALTVIPAAAIALVFSSGSAAAAETPTPLAQIENQLGIKIVGLRRSSAGYMLDFRYRVLDPGKAAPLLDRKTSPYLLDEASGAQLGVPDAPKVGQLRPTSRNNVIPGRDYFILFANPGRYLDAGSKVTLVAGEIRISHLVVE